MIIHQAIYGDQGGAYSLLGTSLKNKYDAKRICNVTDVIDRPVTKELTQPIIRGFAFNKYFLFIKSFPDNTNEKIRKGRVLSHTLIIKLEELYQLNNLEQLFSYFPDFIDKNPILKPITLHNQPLTKIINNNTREALFINSLIDNDKIVWLGEEGYFDFLFILWNSFPKQLRSNLRIGVGFSPNKLDTGSNFTNILYTYDGYENKWIAEGYRVIKKTDIGNLVKQSSFLLAGYKEKAQKLLQLLDSFKLEPKAIHDLSYIEENISLFEGLSVETKFNTLLVLCHFISDLSPNSSLAITDKRKILDLVLSRIEKASPENIVALNNIEWSGFIGSEKALQAEIHNWCRTTLLINTENSDRSNLVIKGLQPDQKNEWWGKAVCSGLSLALSDWKESYAVILFSWFIDEPNLVSLLDEHIPIISKVENSFVTCWTNRVPKEVASPLLILAKEREWFSIYGLASLQLFDSEKSINELLKIDTSPTNMVALEQTAEFIKNDDFINITLNIGEERLLKIAGGIVAAQPSILNQLDVTNKNWQEIWLIAINKGCTPWKNVKEPVTKLYSLCDQTLSGSSVALNLLHELSNHKYTDLSGFKRRKEVWLHLSGNTRSNFIKATTLGCIRLFASNRIKFDSIEDEIIQHIHNPDTINSIISNDKIATKKKIQLFEKIPKLTEKSFITLLTKCGFSSTESKNAGTLIQKNRWKDAARYISNNKNSKNDLKPAYEECRLLVASEDKGWLEFFFPAIKTNQFNRYKEEKISLVMNKPTKILLLATNPKNTESLRLDEEFREIEESINIGKNSNHFKIKKAGALRPKDLRRQLLKFDPNIIHFSGHASPDGIALENESGVSCIITGRKLANLFKLSENLECVILNACFSESQAEEIAQYIPYVIGMRISIGDEAAIEFSKGFYDALSSGKDIGKAFEFGKSAIEMEGINEKETPVLITIK